MWRLTIHSSRRHFAARLNSGVRLHMKSARILTVLLSALFLQGCCHMLGMAYFGSCKKPSGAEQRAAERCIEQGHLARNRAYVQCMAELGYDIPVDPSATEN